MAILNIPAAALTVGGLLVGLAIPAYHLSRWGTKNFKKKQKKDWIALVPMGAGIAYGGLATMCTGGLLAFGTGLITWLGNGAGSLLMWGIGGGNTTKRIRVAPVELSVEGNLILLLLSVALLGIWKAIDEDKKKPAKQGVVSGVLLGLSATLGGAVAVTVIPAVNNMGAALVGAVA